MHGTRGERNESWTWLLCLRTAACEWTPGQCACQTGHWRTRVSHSTHPLATVKHPSAAVHPSATVKHYSAVVHPSATVKHPSAVVHPSATVKHPSAAVHPSATVQHPNVPQSQYNITTSLSHSTTLQHPSATVQHPSATVQHPSFVANGSFLLIKHLGIKPTFTSALMSAYHSNIVFYTHVT